MIMWSILYIISSSASTLRRDKSIYFSRATIIILILGILIMINTLFYNVFEKQIGLLGGFFIINLNTYIFIIFLLIITSLIIQLNGFYPRKLWLEKFNYIFNRPYSLNDNKLITNKMSEQFTILDYPLIILFILIGGTFLLSSWDLISLFISIELQSYGLYILCAVYKNSERAVSGAILYFLLGGLSSCFILLSSALLYSNSGNTGFDGIQMVNDVSNSVEMVNLIYNSSYINFSLTIMAVGLLFKISAAPFHFWSPDVYDSIPTIVTTFVAVFTKISIFILMLHLIKCTVNTMEYYETVGGMFNTEYGLSQKLTWTYALIISSLLSLVIGSILGLTQNRIKRLYAYSTISHLGFILLALVVINLESVQSFTFYVLQYSITNLNAFLLLLVMGNYLYLYKEKLRSYSYEMLDKKNSPIQLISQLKGFFHINPMLSISLAITLFSFVGIPPLIGFFGKQMVLSSALDNGYIFISIVAILTSVISAYYYLMLVKQMFFEETDYTLSHTLEGKESEVKDLFNHKIIKLSSNLSFTISSITLVILLFLFFPEEWLNIVKILSIATFI